MYELTQDSSAYISWISTMPPVYCALIKVCSIFGKFKLDIVVLIQIALLFFASCKITNWLGLKNRYLKALTFCVAISPILCWGLKIGNDLMGYSLMLFALAMFHKNKEKFFWLVVLATLARWQYCFLFCLFLIDRKTIKYFIVSCVLLFLIGFKCGLNPVSRLSIPINYIATKYDTKPDKISHSVWFNKHLDDIAGNVDVSKFNLTKFLKVVGSKIYDNFRLHQLFVIPLLFFLGSLKVRFLLFAASFHYAEILLATSMYFQRYTFMIELCIMFAMLKFLDDYINLRKRNV